MDESRNFRATAWMWYKKCRGCGGEIKYTLEQLQQKEDRSAKRSSEFRWLPAKLCAACVIAAILNIKDE